MVRSRPGIACDGSADPIQRLHIVPLLVGHDTQKVQRIRLIRSRGQDLAIDKGSVIELTALMSLDCFAESVYHGKSESN
jgi:hypothetical protein